MVSTSYMIDVSNSNQGSKTIGADNTAAISNMIGIRSTVNTEIPFVFNYLVMPNNMVNVRNTVNINNSLCFIDIVEVNKIVGARNTVYSSCEHYC